MARTFHLAVGDHMTWEFYQSKFVNGLPTHVQPRPAGRVTFLVAAIADVPPALVNQFDDTPTAILPPAATARFLDGEFQFGWVAMRLHGGDAEVPALQRRLAGLARSVFRTYPRPTGWCSAAAARSCLSCWQSCSPGSPGIDRHAGAVEPPTTSGHPLTGHNQIEFGSVTMRQLGLHIGDQVRVGSYSRPLTVVGTVTLPSFGVVLTDHVSLGRGALMDEPTLLAVQGLPENPTASQYHTAVSSPSYPSAAAIDVSPRADASALTARITAANPDGTPGGTYQLGPQRGAPVVNASQMGSQPVALATGVAAAAVLALGLTVLASVRQRRRELALLKALGLRGRQLRAVVAWQTSITLVAATAVGVPLGLVAGRWAWTSFASTIGVVPTPVVPQLSLAAGAAALLVAGNLLASGPALIAARIPAAATLRAE